ncbi:MAG TPA: VWA domain-containing protein [Acidimicrobiales bacterium]|nr:VWA domain-containing protein [Acidimicrobiales bacterium]
MTSAGDAILAMLLRLFAGLRDGGVDVSLGEVLDAASAMRHVDLIDRDALRTAMQSTLIKRPEDLAIFSSLFDECFPRRRSSPTSVDISLDRVEDVDGLGGMSPGIGIADGDMSAALLDALRDADLDALRLLAVDAVDRFAGMETAKGGERYFIHRVLRALDLANLLVAAMAEARASTVDGDPAELKRLHDDLARRLEQYRRMLAEEIRARLRESGRGAAGTGLVAPRRLEDVDVLAASTTELRQMRQAVRPLARKLASRVSQQRRRHQRGRVDMRRTIRRSLASGGVPMDVAFRRRRPGKPDVVVLCDISGSVAEFAHFTLLLLHALQTELSGLRSFVFVDGVAEVTGVLDAAEVHLDPRLLVTLPGVIAADGHSDYEGAFRRFLDGQGHALRPGTTVIVAGDGRTNYRPAGVGTFREICQRVRRVYWFNPEPSDEWGTDDSALPLYGQSCTGVFEVRSLSQLADAIGEIL